MFTVSIQALAASSQEMQQMVRELGRRIEQLKDIVSSIRRSSAYGGVVHALGAYKDRLEEERGQLVQMMAALNEIQEIYLRCERRLTDYGEQTWRASRHRTMSVVDLTDIREAILDHNIR